MRLCETSYFVMFIRFVFNVSHKTCDMTSFAKNCKHLLTDTVNFCVM